MNPSDLDHIIRVARGLAPASTWIRGASVLNVFTGEVAEGDVTLAGQRIASVGGREPATDTDTVVIDAKGLTLVPGYFEPHAHSCLLYTPKTFADYSVTRGTTAVLQDNLPLFLHLTDEDMTRAFAAFEALPLKSYWWCRLDPQLGDADRMARFTPERIRRTMAEKSVLQAGELTAWKALFDLDADMVARVATARASGKRMEAHNPGASTQTLTVMAAAGLTACHESISAEDVWARVRLGYHAALRNSSIRPDLRHIVTGLLETGFQAWDRLMFTTDGSSPFFLESGSMDACIRLALDAGLPAAIAYRIASYNAASYYRLDADIGSIAPGRIADINFLSALSNPTPERVMVDGAIVAAKGQLVQTPVHIDFAGLGIGRLSLLQQRAEPRWFQMIVEEDNQTASRRVPVVALQSAVITAVEERELPVVEGDVSLRDTPGHVYACVIDQKGTWLTPAIVRGLGDFDAVATSHTMTGDLLVLGRDKTAMAAALNRVMELGGGICVMEGRSVVYELTLPLFNTMTDIPMAELIEATRSFNALMRSFGYAFEDPIYSLLFLSATHLPAIRITQDGLLEVKTGRILSPSRQLPG